MHSCNQAVFRHLAYNCRQAICRTWQDCSLRACGRRNPICERERGVRSPLRGFTLVELLVVITIIGILIALLLPAVQAAREAARGIQCANNFKQVGVAMHNYHAACETFPPGEIHWDPVQGADCGPAGGSGRYNGFGWGAFVLPALDQQNVYDQFDFNGQVDAAFAGNFSNSATRIAAYLCPSDPQQGELVFYTMRGSNGPTPDEDVRQTNMAGVADSIDWTCDSLYPKQLGRVDGMMGERHGCSIAEVRDGTSNTFMIAEVTGGGPGSHRAHYWVTSDVVDTADGINGPNTIPGGGVFPPDDSSGIRGYRGTGPSSFHPGGCYFLFADGSVHFLSENLSSDVIKSLTTRASGDIVAGSEF